MDKTAFVGFLFVVFLTFQSIGDMCEWISKLPYPHWVKGIDSSRISEYQRPVIALNASSA